MLKLISPDSSINGLQLDPTRTRSRRRAPHARSGRRHTSYRAVELTAHGALALTSLGRHDARRTPFNYIRHALARARALHTLELDRDGRCHAADRAVELTALSSTARAPLIMPFSLVVADSMVGALNLTARDDRHTPSAKILLARRTRSHGARWMASRRAASTASRRSAELGSTATVVIVLSRHLFCLLSVGRPSLVCVPPARARLMHARPPVVCLSVSPHVPFGAAQRQVFVPFSGPGTSPGPGPWPCTLPVPCTLAVYFCRGRDLGGLLRTAARQGEWWWETRARKFMSSGSNKVKDGRLVVAPPLFRTFRREFPDLTSRSYIGPPH